MVLFHDHLPGGGVAPPRIGLGTVAFGTLAELNQFVRR